MVLAWRAGVARATPMFSAHVPAHVETARAAWEAATECAGWEAPAHDVVQIRQGYVSGGWSGGAWVDDDGLYRIEVSLDGIDRAIVHEIAHAWATYGPPTLTEGRADLLADCVVSRVPGLAPYDPDPGTELTAMPDLRRWGNPHDDHGLVDIDSARRDAYLGSARLARVLATVVDARTLWPEGGTLRWRDVERILEEAGPRGAMVLGVIEGNAAQQRDALSDRDRDGVPWLSEVLAGTNPDRWDSDGDGWWDGAPEVPSVAAVPVPPDGTPVCAGLAGGPHGGTVQVLYAGEIRGAPTPWVAVQAGAVLVDGDARTGVPVPPDRPVLLSLGGPVERHTGGTWAMAGGQGLVVDWSCRSTPRWTVWVEDPLAAPMLDSFAAALDEHVRRADAILGHAAPRRIVVVLGAHHAGIDGGTVHPDALAGLAVAVHRVWLADAAVHSWDAAEGLARALVDDPPDLAFVAIDLKDAEKWAETASSCPEGWEGVLQGACGAR
jgi:hypothetical protein